MKEIVKMINRCSAICSKSKSCRVCEYWDQTTEEGAVGCFVINYLSKIFGSKYDNRPSRWSIDNNKLYILSPVCFSALRGKETHNVLAPNEYIEHVKKCVILAYIELGVSLW